MHGSLGDKCQIFKTSNRVEYSLGETMAEEKEKIEEMNSPETEKFLSDKVDDNKAEKNFEKQVINCDHSVMNGPGVSPSQSVDSDSNLKTETSESNSMEFSPDLQNDMDDDTKLPENDIQTQSVPQEVTANGEEANNITESPSSTLADNNDVNPSQPEEIIESIETPPNVEVEQDTEQNVPKENMKTGNGSVEEKKEVCPKTTKPPSKAKPRSGKMVFCKIHLLDGQLYETDVTKNATGKELFDKVCAYLTLQEKDYFGLQYQNNNVKFWLNNEKKILKQVKGGTSVFDFSVKFYPPEPMAMLEDLSRFQLCLQVRFDIFNGKLPCSFTTLAVVGSYMVQAEVGDYDNIDEYEFGPGDSYLDKIEYAPDKSPEMRSKVYELHKTHKGLTPEEAELQYLENAKKLAMYGVDLHQARDSTGVKLMLGVCASGIQVYKDKLRINRFVWPAILKLSYKRNNFYVKKRPTENEKDGETIGFKLENHKMAKRLWKTCVEHHAFFRLHQSDPPKSSTFPRFNSKFRYSGRTQKQVRDEVEKIENKPKFDRSHFKYSSMPQTNNTEGYNHGYPDEKDRTDQKGVTTPSTESGPPPYFTDSQGPDGYNTLESSADKPNSMGNMSEDRTDRTPGHEDATQEWSPGAGDAATLEAQRRGKKSKEDKEREKREKEEEKRRKKEEEKERKRLEKERKQGKGAEDRTDKLGDETATLGLNGEHYPGSAGLDSKETIVKETQITNIVQPAVIEASEKIREVVITEVTKEEMKTVKPEIQVEEKVVETVTNVDTSEKVIEEGDAYCIGRNSNTKTEEIKMEEVTEEVAAEKETKDVEKIMENKVEGEILAVLSKSEEIKTIIKQEETVIEDKTINKLEEVKKKTCNGPNEIIEDEVFTEVHKTESVDKPVICNHVGSETGSLSSDSSDDEEVCGSYHVESPIEETPPKIKVETIVEEEQSERRVEIVNCNETETIPVKLTEVEEKTEIKVKESPVISVEEKLIENEKETVTTEKKDIVDSMKVTKTETVSEVKQDIQTEVQKDLNVSSEVHDEKQNNQEILVEDKKDNCERKVDEKRDFDVVVSEQKCVSPDGSQVVSHRSERRTETIQKEVLTHTRRELKPEEFEKYQKEIEAADKKNRMGLQDELGEVRQVIETVVVTDIKNDSGNIVSEETKEKSKLEEPKEVNTPVESDDKKEESVIEVKVVKSENTLEENVKKMKYIDDSSGDSVSEKVKENDETPEVVKQVVNEEAGNENVAPKLDKKESMRLKKEEKERKKKELAEEKERKKREMQEEKERVKREKLEEKERKKKEKEAEKEKKKKEKDEKKSKKNKKTEAVVEQGIEEISDKNVEKTESEKEKTGESAEEVVEERVPTAIALVMAKQKEDEKMEEINLKDEPAEVETPKPEEPVVEANKKQKKSKKEKKEKQSKKEKEKKTPKNKKKHKSTSCFAMSAEPSSDEEEKVEEKPPEEVIEEIVQEEVKPVEEVKVSPKQKGKGLGWALPGMEELQQKGTKHEDSTKRHSTTSSHSTHSTHDDNAKAPIAELTEIQDHNMLNLEPVSMNEEKTTESASEDVPESCATQVEEVTDLVEKTENVMTEAAITTPEVGLGVDGDMINRVLPEGEGSIDRRMQFMPVTPPVQETKDSLKGTSNSTMPFFDSASGDTLGKKVPPPVPPKGMRNGFSEEDRLMQDMPPTIPTESFTYENNTDDIPISTKNVPFVKTKTQTVTYEKDGNPYETEDGILISSQSHSTRTQTIETTTYKTEKDGKVETRVEKKVVITDEGDDDDLDHDDLLAEAIRSVTEMNPDLSVERIECMRQIEEVEK
ncbi:band 4.1-like protein 2 isoform X7 [Mytilus californianus]|uniref:band 4.1-like protein 2 isoform X7 n=1 Tax=Mytilus californianus TaxID=6549 RepID=UPI0022469030|nr:band 4.1-like protein 2 isoform X7 [Mytilus californianus]